MGNDSGHPGGGHAETDARRIVIRHLGGSKTGQVEEFPRKFFKELVLGRDPTCAVRFDPDKDDLVSRAHAKIVPDPAQPEAFLIQDLGSRNGTYVNQQRVAAPTRLGHGDLIELGPGGPRLQFELDPKPEGKATRIAGAVSGPAPTREAPRPAAGPLTGGGPAPAGTVGRATVERMVAEVRSESRTQGRRYMVGGGIALVVLAGALAALFWWMKGPAPPAPPPSPREVAQQVGPSTVFIEVFWKLILTQTGGQVYHQYFPDPFKMPDGREVRFPAVREPYIAAYARMQDGSIEPVLTLDGNSGRPIVMGATGSGFFVSSDGFLLTNRHVGAGWLTSYRLLPPIGVLVDGNGLPMLDDKGEPVYVQAPTDWVPAYSKQAGLKLMGGLEGVNDLLEVTFANQRQRTPAKLARVSDEHDVAMLKIDLPEPVPFVAINDNYETVSAGDKVYVLGYPGASPSDVSVTTSKDAFVREARVRIIPSPTLTEGLIGKVIRTSAAGAVANIEGFSDAYQLTVVATGAGNSGGPLLDEHGQVIGIFYAGGTAADGTRLTFAVPIRYGRKLMGVN